jgi:hypothetical protein
MSAQVVQPENQVKLKSRSIASLGTMRAPPKRAAAGGGSDGGMAAGAGGSIRAGAVGSSAAYGGTLAKSPAMLGKMAQSPLIVTPEDESAARATLQKALPSGLPAVAAAAASHHLLAIDAAGSLFLSEDAGIVWESVARQWTGRAIRISFSPASATAAASPSGASDASSAAAPAPSRFEIVTDRGLTWTSIDGRSWKPN